MFKTITIRGVRGEIVYGYRKAALLPHWTATRHAKERGVWTLTGKVEQVNAFEIRQPRLIFTAPRQKGWWTWTIKGTASITGQTLTATLGPPEH